MGRKVQTWYFSHVNNVEVWFLNKFSTNIIQVNESGNLNQGLKWLVLSIEYRPRGWRGKGRRWHGLLALIFLPTV